MIYYVAHKYQGDSANLARAKRITHDLQVKDTKNCYICPLLAFSELEYNEIGYDAEMELCFDLLCVADFLIVASEITEGVQREIDFAKMIKTEIFTLEDNGDLRPFEDRVGMPD